MKPAIKALPQGEFIALTAFLFAAVALSIDAMLPALPQIGLALSPDNVNRAQLVITAFVFGMGLGTLVAGPLSDAFGRKGVIIAGLGLYAFAAFLCYLSPSLEVLLAARVLQGIGASAPRTVSIAIVRDLYKGRDMARIMSLSQMVFTTVPAIAPLLGAGVIWLAGWQSIFLGYLIFAALCASWFGLRQPETLPQAQRRPLSARALALATVEVLRSGGTTVSILVQSLTLGMLFATLSSVQGIFEVTFGRGKEFPFWFALIAIASMAGSYVNAREVMHLGMTRVLRLTYGAQLTASAGLLVLTLSGLLPQNLLFALTLIWLTGLFAMMGTTLGNLNALAMGPLGHIAGLASSVMSSISTVLSVLLAVPVGLMFNGTALPLILGVTLYPGLALLLVQRGLHEPAG